MVSPTIFPASQAMSPYFGAKKKAAKKAQQPKTDPVKNGLWVTVERYPAIRGGLGQVSKTIPQAMNDHIKKDVRVIMPYMRPLKEEGGFEDTGVELTTTIDGHKEKFKLLQKFEEDTNTWVYAIDNKRLFSTYDDLYGGQSVKGFLNKFIANITQYRWVHTLTLALGLGSGVKFFKIDPGIKPKNYDEFRNIMAFNKVAAELAPQLEKGAKTSDKLKQYDGKIDFVFANDWLTSPFLAEIEDNKDFDPTKIFMLHNIFNQPRPFERAEQVGLKIPDKLRESFKEYSPLGLGIKLADSVIANWHYMRTITKTDFCSYGDFVAPLKEKGDANKVFDMHHGLSKAYEPDDNKALKEDGWTELKNQNDWSRFKKVNKAALQKDLQLNEDPNATVFSWVARFDPTQKGFYLLMDEAMDFLEAHPKAQLIMAGFYTGDKRVEEFQKKCEEASAGKYKGRLHFTTKKLSLEKIAQFYAGSDFVLLPSLYEPYGLTQLEGIKLGAIPIVHSVDGLRTTISDDDMNAAEYRQQKLGKRKEISWGYGQNGIKMAPMNDMPLYRQHIWNMLDGKSSTDEQVAEAKDAQQKLRDAMDRAMDISGDTRKMTQIRKNGLKYVNTEHTWEKIAKRYQDALQKTFDMSA